MSNSRATRAVVSRRRLQTADDLHPREALEAGHVPRPRDLPRSDDPDANLARTHRSPHNRVASQAHRDGLSARPTEQILYRRRAASDRIAGRSRSFGGERTAIREPSSPRDSRMHGLPAVVASEVPPSARSCRPRCPWSGHRERLRRGRTRRPRRGDGRDRAVRSAYAAGSASNPRRHSRSRRTARPPGRG